MKKKTEKQKFSEVRTDYTTPEGNIAVDAWLTSNDDEGGRTVCWVSPDGEIIKGTNPECEKDDLECSLVQEAIKDAKNAQEELKEKIADEVLEQVKKDAEGGDFTVLYELLSKFVPARNLVQALPEEKWKNYPIEIK